MDLLTPLMETWPLENSSVATPYTCVEWGVPIILSNGGISTLTRQRVFLTTTVCRASSPA